MLEARDPVDYRVRGSLIPVRRALVSFDPSKRRRTVPFSSKDPSRRICRGALPPVAPFL